MMTTLLNYLVLPTEVTAFEATYLKRMNRIALIFFWMHLPVFTVIALVNGTGVVAAAVMTAAVLVGPTLAIRALSPRQVSLVYGFTAMCMGALLVHFGQGIVQLEMHFYFFVLLALLAVFANPMVVIVAAVTAAVHHAAFWLLLPESVFNYAAPIWVVAIHAFLWCWKAWPPASSPAASSTTSSGWRKSSSAPPVNSTLAIVTCA